jgi:hypothetical protein
MSALNLDQLVRSAELIYERDLRSKLEPEHENEFVAIEPESGDFYLGATLSQAIGAAREAHPNQLCHAVRVGHKAALHFGVHVA